LLEVLQGKQRKKDPCLAPKTSKEGIAREGEPTEQGSLLRRIHKGAGIYDKREGINTVYRKFPFSRKRGGGQIRKTNDVKGGATSVTEKRRVPRLTVLKSNLPTHGDTIAADRTALRGARKDYVSNCRIQGGVDENGDESRRSRLPIKHRSRGR